MTNHVSEVDYVGHCHCMIVFSSQVPLGFLTIRRRFRTDDLVHNLGGILSISGNIVGLSPVIWQTVKAACGKYVNTAEDGLYWRRNDS